MDLDKIKYIELKTGYNDDGPAWIGKVKYSKSGKTIYFNGLTLKSCKGQGIGANYYDLKTGLEFWVSGIKKKGWNRHWAGRGKIMIEKSLVDWFTQYIYYQDKNFLEIIEDCPQTDIEEINKIENEKNSIQEYQK